MAEKKREREEEGCGQDVFHERRIKKKIGKKKNKSVGHQHTCISTNYQPETNTEMSLTIQMNMQKTIIK